MSSLISCVSWVKRGVAAQHPSKYILDDKELERVSSLARIELEDARLELQRAHEAAQSMGLGAEEEDADENGDEKDEEDESAWVDEEDVDRMHEDRMDEDLPETKKAEDDLAQYNLDDYDNDDAAPALGLFSNIKGLKYYKDNEDDPYITLKDDNEDDEREDLEILPTDNLLVVAKTEDEVSQLEVYVYDESEENLYAHHDLLLPNFPLCLEWLDFPPAQASTSIDVSESQPQKPFGNYIAVGTMDPEIEIWSLDTVEGMYPDMVLGRPDKTAAHVPVPLGTGKKKRKKNKTRTVSSYHHVDAVLSLSWNRTHRNLLASASADKTVKLWDLSRDPSLIPEGAEGVDSASGCAIRSFDNIHEDKIQSVQWNQADPTVLLTGSYDRTVKVFDSRAPDACLGTVVSADVEALRWDPWNSHFFYVSLEDGTVLNFDARTLANKPNTPTPARFTLAAHDGAASALDVNPHIPGCIVTGGTDKMVKIWNINESTSGKAQVSLVTSRDLGIGKVFSAVFSPDDALTVAAAGSKAKLQVWDVGSNLGVRKAFGAKLSQVGQNWKERQGGGVIGVASDDESDEERDKDD